jgi:hypothetical protein
MNKELIQKLFSKSCWDEQAEVDIEDFISVEKFAELIVRECLSYAKDGDLDFMKFMIKKNFGVEE